MLPAFCALWYNLPELIWQMEAKIPMTRSSQRRKRRDWRRTIFLIISILIVLSMAISLAVAFAPPPAAP